jgi:PAS domain S-box-containing protein
VQKDNLAHMEAPSLGRYAAFRGRSIGLPLSILIAAALIGGITIARLLLTPYLGDRMPFVLYLPALVAVGWWLGLRAYLLASGLALVLMVYFFLHPQWAFGQLAQHDVVRIGLDIVVIAAMGIVIGRARHFERGSRIMARAVQEGRERETIQREELARFIGQVRNQAIFTLNPDGIISSWNPGVRDVLGYEENEFIGLHLSRLFPDDEARAGAAEEELRTATERGSAGNDRWMRRRDGSHFFAAGSTSVVRSADGRLVGFTKVMRDLTEVQAALEAREESEARFRGIIDSAMDAIITVDDAQRITIFNPAAERMFRCRAGDVLGSPLDRFIPAKYRERHRGQVDRFGATGTTARSMGVHQPNGVPLTALRDDGEMFPIEATISQVQVGSRRFYTAIVRDISERLRHEEVLAAANERFRLMADASPVLIWVSDTSSACTWFNQGWLAFTGRTLRQECGAGWADGVHEEDRERCRQVYTEAFERRESFEIEYRLRRHDGEYRWLLDRGLPYFTAPGVFGGFIGACIDITEARSFREELGLRAAELERSNTDLQDFAYIVSHDLKEPLRGISNYATFVLEDHGEVIGEDGTQKLETIRRLARRSYDLLDAILQFSRIGREGLNVEEVPIDALFSRALDTLRGRIEEEQAEVAIDIDRTCSATVLRCDPDLALQALTNLVSNALKYNKSEPKRIVLGCAPRGGDDGPALYVRDNGIGIEPRYRDMIFRMFKRLHGRDRFGGGTGAGLAIVKRIVERHGGRIWVESEPGLGSTFMFTLRPTASPRLDAPTGVAGAEV